MNTNEMTLASAFEAVATRMKESHLTTQAFAEVAEETSYISNKLKVNPAQAFILATMLHHVGQKMEVGEFAKYADVSPIRMMALQKDFDSLVNRGLIVLLRPKVSACEYWQQQFAISAGMIQATKYNKRYSPVVYKDLSAQDILDMISELFKECDYSRLSYRQMIDYLEKLIADAQCVEFFRKVKELGLCQSDLVLFLIGVVSLVSHGENLVVTSDYEDILPKISQRQMVRQFKEKRHILAVKGLMEATDDDFDTYRLTNKAKAEYLKDFGIEAEEEESCDKDNTEEASTEEKQEHVVEKKLFYNAAEKLQVERLKVLLSHEKFGEVRSRMRAAGMLPGFACLFYGAPGTGKTETAMQLARATGREVVKVNMADLRDRYVGESEKNVQKVFDDYREKLEESEVTPILLFNEADGIFGNRYTGINDAVDQMENTLQNIILQNMETFEGILIATTNLTDNFDKAFERRFLFKICFEKPKAEVRKQIWMSVLPKLTPEDAAVLAMRSEFTGAMIENVARRLIIDEVLYDHPVTLDTMKRLCDEEQIRKPTGIRKWNA